MKNRCLLATSIGGKKGQDRRDTKRSAMIGLNGQASTGAPHTDKTVSTIIFI